MSKNMHSNIPTIIICPRCKDEVEWVKENPPSQGWVCQFCREELNMKSSEASFGQCPMNEMEERRLDEDWDGEIENIPKLQVSGGTGVSS
jgi:predicted metal-binding protein